MGGATRFIILLAAPFPPLRPSLLILRHRLSTLTTTPLRPFTLSSSRTKSHTSHLVNSFHSQLDNNAYNLNFASASQKQNHHPWPEWTHFLNSLSDGQGWSAPNSMNLKIPPEDAFVVYEELPDDFVLAASNCLSFARDRPNLLGLLSRRNMEAVVSNGTPFLFKSALDCARRMKAFLGTDQGNLSEYDKATTVDLMKYIISYASNPTVSSGKNGLYSRELVDSSIRSLLHELGTVSGAPTGYTPAQEQQFSGRYGQTPRPLGRNIEMKRGDWVCSKCNFMNFARNMKCLECEEPRPQKQLTGGEWNCPQCNFFNYGRNVLCLRCDCRRPGAPLFNANSGSGNANSGLGTGYNGDYSFKANIDSRLVENEEEQNRFSEISPRETLISHGNSKGSVDQILGRSSSVSERNDTRISARQETPFSQFSLDDQHPSFVPISADSSSKNERISDVEDSKIIRTRAHETVSSEARNQGMVSSEAQSFDGNFQFPKDSGGESKVQEQSGKSDNWFKKVVDLYDDKDLPSTISDEDFPAMMPMPKGKNRFVVSQKKDRSLTSPKYKRQVALDQAKDSNFVPFVPFPPGYFARKETQQPDGLDSGVKTTTDTPSQKITIEPENIDRSRHIAVPTEDEKTVSSQNSDFAKRFMADTSTETRRDNLPRSTESSQFSGDIVTPPTSSPDRSSIMSHTNNNNSGKLNISEYENVRSSWTGKSLEGLAVKEPDTTNNNSGKLNISDYENVRSSWTGKSLEGSAVKEPDPLDMSEEAKAERWFKRVAQIKDISELSQIPDEDFPSIMPMRKGVNRFVVSKRKTPLERRLTSQQYRRSLPIVSTEKNESDNNS